MKKRTADHSRVPQTRSVELGLNADLFRAGDRICVAVSGGADSTALLHALLDRREEFGIVLTVVHVNHGLRGEAADQDAEFVADLAKRLGVPCETIAVDTDRRARENKETIEEAARNLRYQAFRDLLNSGKADKIATAHTLGDQAETVLMKLLRGAWTDGMSGIHPTLRLREVARSDAPVDCVRPLLCVRRSEIETYLHEIGQPWREDASNRSLAHTRNRIRHELLPLLCQFNPQIESTLARMATNAQAEEQHWRTELTRVLPQILLSGKPVRGGGRSVDTRPGCASFAVDLARLAALDSGLQRRVLRAAAKECGVMLDFQSTERLLNIASSGKRKGANGSAKRLELPGGVRVERSLRDLQFERRALIDAPSRKFSAPHEPFSEVERTIYELTVPGSVEAVALGSRFSVGLAEPISPSADRPVVQIRGWRPGDKVELRHSQGAKKVKEILERMRLKREDKERWPVVVWQGRIVWMRGVDVSQTPLDRGVNGSNHGKGCIFLIRESLIDVEGSR